MENCFGQNSHELDLKYDLKGSHYGRECSQEELNNKDIARKDINFERDVMRGDI